MKWTDIFCLGKYCPGLEVLKLPAVLEGYILPEVEEVTPLPALRSCAISQMGCHRSGSPGTFIFSRPWRVMPSIEEISIGSLVHVAPLSREPLPRLGQAFDRCPASLRKVYLRGFELKADHLIGIDMNQIESITLSNCNTPDYSGDMYAVLQTFQRMSNITSTITQERDAVCLIKRSQA